MKGNITKKLFQSAMLTMLIAELSGAGTAIIDGIITGHYLGSTSLAAHGIGSPYFSIASIISGILMVGSTAMCTRSIGKGDTPEADRIFSLTMVLGVGLSVLLALSGTIFAGPIARMLGARGDSAALYDAVRDYLRGIFPGAPGFILFAVLTPFLQLDGDSTRPKIGSLVMAIVDVSGDLLNVFVFHGGMFGMGLASALSHYAALFVVLSHFIGKRSMFSFSFANVHFRTTPALMRDGLPRAMCMLCRGLLPMLLNPLVLSLSGPDGVAALSAMNSSSYVVGSLGWGIGGAMLIMSGMMVGESDVHGLSDVVKSALTDILTGVVLVSIVVFAAAPAIAELYIPGVDSARIMAITAIRGYAIGLPFLAFNVSFANYYQATGRTRHAHIVNICIEFVCTALLSVVLCPMLGVTAVWIAFPLGSILLTAILVIMAIFKKSSERSGLAAYLPLTPGFSVPESDILIRSVRTMDEVVSLSVDVGAFCLDHSISSGEANRLALCVEELAGNVIRHGFSDNKPHSLDVRVIVKDGHSVLRLRDDCREFDLRKMTESWTPDPEHPEHNIGTRLVMAAAKDIAYTHTMNTNNLIITV